MSTSAMSGIDRRNYLRELAANRLDVVVIGGGITGAGIALDAASRGLSVGLLEKADFGGGTSSKSTKLIHGGLRYLKQGDINLVREVGRERAVLHRNAPHLVIPERMLLPIVRGGTYGRLASSFGLWLYDWLAGVRRHERRSMLDPAKTLQAEPLLRGDGLLGGGLYYEYRTDDARLTIEVLKTAVQYGAVCVNYAEVEELTYDAAGKVCGVVVHDKLSGERQVVAATMVVNAAGPWVDHVRTLDHSLYGKRLHHTKGVHIVLPHERLPIQQSVYFDVPDGRMVFAIPRFDVTYVGTTDTDYHGPLDHVYATTSDVEYLLNAVNHMFPTVRLQREDVVSTWAGVRPLIHEDGKSASELSRRDEVIHSESGLITMAGGKLTGYRKMAERIVDLVMDRLHDLDGRPIVECRTDGIVISGGDIPNGSVSDYIDTLIRLYPTWSIGRDIWYQLVSRYGSHVVELIDIAESLAQEAASTQQGGESGWSEEASSRRGREAGLPEGATSGQGDERGWSDGLASADLLLRAEVVYGVRHEMVTSLSDFLVRRTGRLYFERPKVAQMLSVFEAELARQFGWDESAVRRQHAEIEDEMAEVIRFRDGVKNSLSNMP